MRTVFIYCLEDDANLTSAFFMDLGNLVAARRDNVRIVARYRSYSFYKSYDIIIEGTTPMKIALISPVNHAKGFLLKDVTSFLRQYRDKRSREENALVIQSHGYDDSVQAYEALSTRRETYSDMMTMADLAARIPPSSFDAIFLDACCMSAMSTLRALQGVAKYVIACQFTCPYLGILSERFVTIFGMSKPLPQRLALISQAFVDRNKNRTKKWRKVSDKTDSVVVDMSRFKAFLEAYDRAVSHEGLVLRRSASSRVVVYKEYLAYDVYGLLKTRSQSELAALLKRSIVSHVKTHSKMKNNGVSIELRKQRETPHTRETPRTT
jgi:hypothetical protein